MSVYRVLFLGISCLAYSIAQASSGTDFSLFAQEQANQLEQVIAPHLPEVEKLQANALAQIEKVDKSSLPSRHLEQEQILKKNKNYTPLLVFVSFSMPKESLQQWIIQTTRAGGSVVLRGLVDNSFRKTAEVLSPLLEKEGNGLIVDPLLFQKFSIEKVPAVIVQQEVDCPVNQDCPPANYSVIYGDVTLSYALEQIKKMDSPESVLAADALKKLTGKKYA